MGTHNVMHSRATRGGSVAVQHELDIVLQVSMKFDQMLLQSLDIVVNSVERCDVGVRTVVVFEADKERLISATVSDWAGKNRHGGRRGREDEWRHQRRNGGYIFW